MEKPYSFSSDIWALGCVAYELACLRVPFDATSLQSLVQKITPGGRNSEEKLLRRDLESQ